MKPVAAQPFSDQHIWWELGGSAQGCSPCCASAGCGCYNTVCVRVCGRLEPGTCALQVGFSFREDVQHICLCAQGLLCHWEA